MAEGPSEAEIVRSALTSAAAGCTYPPARLALCDSGERTRSERVDEELPRDFGG